MSETPPNNTPEAMMAAATAEIFSLVRERLQQDKFYEVAVSGIPTYVVKIPELGVFGYATTHTLEIDDPFLVDIYDYRPDTRRHVVYNMTASHIKVQHFQLDTSNGLFPIDERQPISGEELVALHTQMFPEQTEQ